MGHKSTKKSFCEEKQCKNKMVENKNNIDKNRYLQLKSKSTQIMSDTKKLFIQNKIQNSGRDSRKMYKIINKLMGRRDEVM